MLRPHTFFLFLLKSVKINNNTLSFIFSLSIVIHMIILSI
ncbi:hypothetical protein HMPREF9078_02505 [Capnocytophaga sp. oral taxon 380 str. F0488]|nr:hypothetical protein HMPREF9078_02505 [Capnocytophaga sp. oral taxon 380 str. F0488]